MDKLPLPDPLQILKPGVPAGAAEAFRDGLLFAKLSGGGADLLGHNRLFAGKPAQPVAAGNL
ncbi:hypothetical protein D3C75_806770 [compost metagenome]